MIVMPANNSKLHVGYLAGKFPGRLGHLYAPDGFRGPYEFLPYALDNGKFSVWARGKEWDEAGFIALLERVAACEQKPRWVVVPDVVGDAIGTLREWDRWEPRLRPYGFPLACAVQDGMVPETVPSGADVVFIGGTTTWKRQTLWRWCRSFPRVHVGRINTERWLWECHKAGAESCDGTGWYRGDDIQLRGLVRYLTRSHDGLGPAQLEMEFDSAITKEFRERHENPALAHGNKQVPGARSA